MTLAEKFQTLFEYHWHTNGRLLDLAAGLGEAALDASPDAGRRTMRELLFHVLSTDRNWRLALETGQQPRRLDTDNYPKLESLREGFASEKASWSSLLEQWDDEQLNQELLLMTLRGDAYPVIRWRVLQHLILHGMQHHTELAHLLTEHGQSPGDIDFIFYG